MKRSALQKSIFITYLLLLSICIGIELSVGALVAPIIFNPAQFLGDGVLSHFQSGIMMTQIFLRFNVILMVITSFVLAYEIYMFYSRKFDLISAILILVVLGGSVLFVAYFTPFIVDAQLNGAKATQTQAFHDMHKGSELVIKVVLIAQISLFFRRVWLELK